MTVFPDGSKERLHGHNYYVGVAVDLSDIRFEAMVPFQLIKEATAQLCRQWREHLLLARDNPYFELVRDGDGELEFRLCGERYVVPRHDAIILPIDNIAVEPISEHICGLLIEQIPELAEKECVTGLEVRVTESPGQGASSYHSL
ncbi:MAG: 6-carboxytetrahydropterin synthase, partial [Myxococcota bacterium]